MNLNEDFCCIDYSKQTKNNKIQGLCHPAHATYLLQYLIHHGNILREVR